MTYQTRPQQTIELLAGRLTIAVLVELSESGRRYQDLDTLLDDVSHKVLTDTLRRAERDGLITRHVDSSRVDTSTLYELTDLGRSRNPLLKALAEWGDQYWADVEVARGGWDRRSY